MTKRKMLTRKALKLDVPKALLPVLPRAQDKRPRKLLKIF